MKAKEVAEEILALADVKINGERDWDIQVHNEKFYSRVLAEGTMGLGESYMDGWWDVKKLDQFFFKVFEARLDQKLRPVSVILPVLKAKLMNLQTKSKSKQVAEQHYDLGNEFYAKMLDKRMQYTCAYWPKAKNLETAQEHKLKLICEKLKLKKGEKVLELGCGWGGFAKYASENYGVEVTCYNISKEQVEYAREINKDNPVTIHLQDYREATGIYDKVASIGLMEHVGHKNYRGFMELAHRSLKPNGIFLLHTIGNNKTTTTGDPWVMKYIFPGGMLPSSAAIAKAFDGLFVMEDWHNLGADYSRTLMAWNENFNKHWKSDDVRFYRMWSFYLLLFAGAYRARQYQLFQVVLSKGGVPGDYVPIR